MTIAIRRIPSSAGIDCGHSGRVGAEFGSARLTKEPCSTLIDRDCPQKDSDRRKSTEKAESGNLRRIPIHENSHPTLNRAEFNTAAARIAKAGKKMCMLFVCFSVFFCVGAILGSLRGGDSRPPRGDPMECHDRFGCQRSVAHSLPSQPPDYGFTFLVDYIRTGAKRKPTGGKIGDFVQKFCQKNR
jgi:hypothetical protein